MKKFLLVNYTTPNSSANEIPYLWLTLKSYFQRNSKVPSAWQWLDPEYSDVAESPQELIDRIVIQEPDVVGISCYMWNDKLTMYIAEQVKIKLPNIKIIAGGPALYYEHFKGWFVENWFIDALCEYSGYGEVFITDYLDGVPIKDIPFCVYPSLRRAFWNKATSDYNKREFNYPMPYLDNIEYLKKFPKEQTTIILDTSRGCPYACSYCEWGGGTSTKVVFKPIEETIKELEVIFEYLNPTHIDIINANFGIVKDDIKIAKKIVELNNNKCVKYINVYGPTKTSKKFLREIYDIFLSNGILDDIKVSVQHTNQTILDNISRIDMPFDDQIEFYTDLRDKYNKNLRAELIIGLPGETLDTFYDLIEHITKSKYLEPTMYEWMMLPSAPAASPEYMSSMKIKTKKALVNLDLQGRNVIPRNEYTVDKQLTGTRHLLFDQNWLQPYDIVVSTYSYGVEQWVEMEMFKYYFSFLNRNRVITPIQNRLRSNGVDITEFNRTLFKEFLLSIPTISKIYNEFIDNINNETPSDILYADIAPNLPYISHYSTLKFLILLNPEGFFNALKIWLKKYDDAILDDICDHLSDNIKTPMKMDIPQKQKISECISMCKNWGDNLFLDDFVPQY